VTRHNFLSSFAFLPPSSYLSPLSPFSYIFYGVRSLLIYLPFLNLSVLQVLGQILLIVMLTFDVYFFLDAQVAYPSIAATPFILILLDTNCNISINIPKIYTIYFSKNYL
jgi:hypothetical protein